MVVTIGSHFVETSKLQASIEVGTDQQIFVSAGGCLHAVSSIDGEVIWRREFTDRCSNWS